MEKMTINSRYTWNGALELTTIYKGEYYWHQYLYYTKREACRLFREFVRKEGTK